jgi:hypothetical protein
MFLFKKLSPFEILRACRFYSNSIWLTDTLYFLRRFAISFFRWQLSGSASMHIKQATWPFCQAASFFIVIQEHNTVDFLQQSDKR